MSDQYGVLLPVRLETRFIPPGVSPVDVKKADDSTKWRLRLRLVPDDVSIVGEEPSPASAEIAHVQALWDTLKRPADLHAARAHAGWTDAFARLAAATAPARADWLVSNLEIEQGVVSWAGTAADETHPRLIGLPARIEVWALWAEHAGGAVPIPEVLDVLEPGQLATSEPRRLTDSMSLDRKRRGPGDPWWSSWDGATAAGLAKEITLDRHPEEISVLGVSGIGPADGATPESLFRAHTQTGQFQVLRSGIRTSTAFGADTVDGEQFGHWAAGPAGTTSAAQGVVRALTGVTDIGAVPVDPYLSWHQDVSRWVLDACFPALWGYGLTGVLGVPSKISDLGRVWRWSARWLRAEGNYPPVRIGDCVYSVLPLASPAPGTVDGVAHQPTESWQDLDPMLPMLGRIARSWADTARGDLGLIGGTAEDVARVLRRGPVPDGLRWRPLIPAVIDGIAAGGTPNDGKVRWLDANWALLSVLGPDEIGRPYVAGPHDRAMTKPLLGPGLDSTDETPDIDPLLAFLWEISVPLADRSTGKTVPGRNIDARLEPDKSLLLTLYARSLAVSGQLLHLLTTAQDDRLLLERIAGGRKTRAFEQIIALGNEFSGNGEPLVDAIQGLSPDRLEHLLKGCQEDPARRPITVRALRATIDGATARWDPWLVGIGAAHAEDALTHGATPTLGCYGWVDRPFRGRPGPGPGGLQLAPSQAQAATLAVLRDRHVHDPDRWAMKYTSAQVGAARDWLSRVGHGWHPAELTGRLLENEIASNVPPELLPEVLDQLRADPLVPGQGEFGCTHGDLALARWKAITAGAEAPFGPWLHPDVMTAGAVVSRMLDAAADLLIAEGAHTFLQGQPARAAAAMRALAGKSAPPPLSVLAPDWPHRSVETVVLRAFPLADHLGDGIASIASPSVEATLATRFSTGIDWVVKHAEQLYSVSAADLDCGLLDLATLGRDTVDAMASLAVAAGRGTPLAEGAATGPGPRFTELVAWCEAARGRPADIGDLAVAGPTRSTEQDQSARDDAVRRLQLRRTALRAAAEELATDLEAWVAARTSAEHTRIEAETQAGEGTVQPLPPGPVPAEVHQSGIALALRTAPWALAPPSTAAEPTWQAIADLTTYLRDSEAALRARLAATTDEKFALQAALGPGVEAETSGGDPVLAASALAELTGRPGLPIGSGFSTALDLRPAGTELIDGWLPVMTAVRPRLELLGTDLYSTSPEDPWRVAALAAAEAEAGKTAPAPRLTVAVAEQQPVPGELYEWLVLDSFTESVADPQSVDAGIAFDTATPSARPPAAILLVPAPVPGSGGPSNEETRALVAYARTLAHARMAEPEQLQARGLGALTSWAVLPQHDPTGARLGQPAQLGTPIDSPAVLVPYATGTDDVLAAVTGDPLWALGVQWRLGEHAGEDAATPLRVQSTVTHTSIRPPHEHPDRDPALLPIEACIEVEPDGVADHWSPERLAYSASFPVGDSELHVSGHTGGPAQWWATRSSTPLISASTETATKLNSVPTRLEWPGQPQGRYWQIEDRRRDPAGTGPDLTQPAVLHLIDVLSRHSEDLFVAPVRGRLGTVLRPGAVTMIDAAGGEWPLVPPRDWSLVAVEKLDPPPPDGGDPGWQRGLPLFADAATALEGPVIDDLAFAIDEQANVLWAAELVVDGNQKTAAHGTHGPAALDRAKADSLRVTWQLSGDLPPHRFPFVHGRLVTGVPDADREMFLSARLAGGQPPASEPLRQTTRLTPLAIPASGIRLTRRAMLARAADGTPVTWLRRATRPLDVSIDIPLTWDPVEPTTP